MNIVQYWVKGYFIHYILQNISNFTYNKYSNKTLLKVKHILWEDYSDFMHGSFALT